MKRPVWPDHEPKHDRDGLLRCYVCGCSDREPCNPPCGWQYDDICSTCANAVAALVEWREAAPRPMMSRLIEVAAHIEKMAYGLSIARVSPTEYRRGARKAAR
jgi:hypothetical protein